MHPLLAIPQVHSLTQRVYTNDRWTPLNPYWSLPIGWRRIEYLTNGSFPLKQFPATAFTARYEHNLHQLLPFVSCDASGQVIKQRRGYSNVALDFYQVLPSTSIRCSLNRDAVLHLCCYRDAGMCFVSKLWRRHRSIESQNVVGFDSGGIVRGNEWKKTFEWRLWQWFWNVSTSNSCFITVIWQDTDYS